MGAYKMYCTLPNPGVNHSEGCVLAKYTQPNPRKDSDGWVLAT